MELTELVSTTEAARIAGVAVCTISSWKRRGRLTPVRDKPPLYTRSAVLDAAEHLRLAGEGVTVMQAALK